MKRKNPGSVVTIGVFDGVHAGHRRLLDAVVRAARRRHCESVVLTFDPHPAALGISRTPPLRIMPLAHRLRIIKSLGIDRIVVIPFTRALRGMSAEQFVERIIVGTCHALEVCVSDKFHFGRGGRAGAATLRRLGAAYGFRVKDIPPVLVGGAPISSSRIRRLVMAGDLARAARLLGRHVSVYGTVVRGRRLGRKLGFRTANINPHHELTPPSGVYAARVELGGRVYGAVVNVGVRPTVYPRGDVEPLIEAHILNFNKMIYRKDVEVFFIHKIRAERKFPTEQALAAAIAADVRTVRQFTSAPAFTAG